MMASRIAGFTDTDAFIEDGRLSIDKGDLSIDRRGGGDGW